jgi:hypothetical protein
MIAQREREKGVRVLTNGATSRWSYIDGHMTVLNKGGRCFSNREMVPGARRRDWSWGECGG